jgi:hypothetical protein
MQQFPCPGCGKLLQVTETEAARASRCPACAAVFRPDQVMSKASGKAAEPGPAPVPDETIQDLRLRRDVGQESRRDGQRTWFLLGILLLPWCVLNTLCAFGSLLDFVMGVLRQEPAPVIGLGLFLAFSASLLSLWMCSNTRRPVPHQDAERDEDTFNG